MAWARRSRELSRRQAFFFFFNRMSWGKSFQDGVNIGQISSSELRVRSGIGGISSPKLKFFIPPVGRGWVQSLRHWGCSVVEPGSWRSSEQGPSHSCASRGNYFNRWLVNFLELEFFFFFKNSQLHLGQHLSFFSTCSPDLGKATQRRKGWFQLMVQGI